MRGFMGDGALRQSSAEVRRGRGPTDGPLRRSMQHVVGPFPTGSAGPERWFRTNQLSEGAVAAAMPLFSVNSKEPDGVELREAQRAEGELIRACQAGDQDAFGVLVRRYHGRAYWAAYGLLGNEEEARDVTQDAFLRVYRALERFDFNQNFYTWMYRIVVNLAIDRLRRNAKGRSVALDDVGDLPSGRSAEEQPARGMELAETAVLVREVLDQLPEKYRTVMVLRELNGLSCKEIAGIVNSSHATVRWRLHMARKFFKEEWERRQHRSERGESVS